MCSLAKFCISRQKWITADYKSQSAPSKNNYFLNEEKEAAESNPLQTVKTGTSYYGNNVLKILTKKLVRKKERTKKFKSCEMQKVDLGSVMKKKNTQE